MTIADILVRVREIEATGANPPNGQGDDERAHGMEDDLHQDVLRAIGDGNYQESVADLARAALRTRDLKFSRWYA